MVGWWGAIEARDRTDVEKLPLRTADTPLYSATLSSRIHTVCRAIESA